MNRIFFFLSIPSTTFLNAEVALALASSFSSYSNSGLPFPKQKLMRTFTLIIPILRMANCILFLTSSEIKDEQSIIKVYEHLSIKSKISCYFSTYCASLNLLRSENLVIRELILLYYYPIAYNI